MEKLTLAQGWPQGWWNTKLLLLLHGTHTPHTHKARTLKSSYLNVLKKKEITCLIPHLIEEKNRKKKRNWNGMEGWMNELEKKCGGGKTRATALSWTF